MHPFVEGYANSQRDPEQAPKHTFILSMRAAFNRCFQTFMSSLLILVNLNTVVFLVINKNVVWTRLRIRSRGSWEVQVSDFSEELDQKFIFEQVCSWKSTDRQFSDFQGLEIERISRGSVLSIFCFCSKCNGSGFYYGIYASEIRMEFMHPGCMYPGTPWNLCILDVCILEPHGIYASWNSMEFMHPGTPWN